MPMPHRTQMQVIKRRLVGKEGGERIKELRAILDELPGYRNGPYADIRKWVSAQIEETRVRKKTVYTPPPGEGRSRTPVKVAGPTHPVYIAVMLGLMLLGLVWLVVNYIAGPNIAWMNALGSWNFLIGFALIVIGLLMTMRWR